MFEKILNLNSNEEYINFLIFEVEVLYELKDKHSLNFDIDSMGSRLKGILLDEKISDMQKKIDLCDTKEKKKILGEIQNLTKEKNGC
jgi:hypothetical protein